MTHDSTTHDSTTTEPALLRAGLEEKERLIAANRVKLEEDLWEGRMRYASRPRVVDMQLTNFCNMSCTMCYDGENPPLRKLPPEIVERFGADVFPTASILVPFAGSEPLIVTWDLARGLAERYGLELDIITNVQFLDEAKFREMEPFVSSVTFSIDSHLRDVYEAIRLRSQPDKVFRNLPVAARLCREHGIEAQANIVYMVENAPYLDGTVAYLADAGVTTVRLLQYIRLPHLSAERDFSNAMLHLGPEWLAWMNGRIRRVAREKGIRVIFDLQEKEVVDHLPDDVRFRPDRKESPYFHRLLRYYPGYCWQSVDRVKVNVDGRVYPCCMGDDGALALGNVFEQSFEEIWNGPESQDLRRGMMTGDVPGFCKGCSFHESWILEELDHLPVVDWFHEVHAPAVPRLDEERRTLEVQAPAHMTRSPERPTFRWKRPARPVDRFVLALGPGGEWNDENVTFTVGGDATEFTPSEEEWSALRANMGWWWCLWGVVDERPEESLRAPKVRCLIRHQDIPRVPGSTLYEAAAQPKG